MVVVAAIITLVAGAGVMSAQAGDLFAPSHIFVSGSAQGEGQAAESASGQGETIEVASGAQGESGSAQAEAPADQGDDAPAQDGDAAVRQDAPTSPAATIEGVCYFDAKGKAAEAPACAPLADAIATGSLEGGWYVLDEGECVVDGTVEVHGETHIVIGEATLRMLGSGRLHVASDAKLGIHCICGKEASARVEGSEADMLVDNEGVFGLYGCMLGGAKVCAVENRDGAMFVMYEGRIEANGGDGVLSHGRGVVGLHGGQITSNGGFGVSAESSVSVDGTAVVSGNGAGNIDPHGKRILVCGKLDKCARIGVTWTGDKPFTMEYGQYNADLEPCYVFTCDDGTSQVEANEDGEAFLAGGMEYRNAKGKVVHTERGTAVHDFAADPNGCMTMGDEWYCVSRSTTVNGRVTVSGNAKLILCDGATLTINGGMRLSSGNSLTIYGQRNMTGKLDCEHGDAKDEAAIGGNKGEAGGSVTVCGGNVTAQGGEDAAGIGGGCDGKGGTVEVLAGFVEAKGKEYGAGIGGGRNGEGGTFTIRGGHVVGYGSGYDKLFISGGGAGIGGGDSAKGGDVYVYGGDLEANASYLSAAIGGGDKGAGGNFTMYGGKVRTYPCYGGAGIGGGNKGVGGDVKIYGGELDLQAGSCGSGIGGGRNAAGGTVLIQDAKVKITVKNIGSGIGGGSDGDGGGEVKIVRSDVTCDVHSSAAIGGGFQGSKACSKVTIEDSTVVAKTTGDAAAIGGGEENRGIGCRGGDGGTVIIRNSHVTAEVNPEGGTGYCGGAAIGGGRKGKGGDVIIEGDSVVDAKTGAGAAIGRGECASDDAVGTVKLPPNAKVISYDDNGRVAPAAERAEYCKYRNHVRIEPCDHAGVTYTKTRNQHTPHCKYCNVESGGAHDHDFGEGDTCKDCGYRHTMPKFAHVTPATSGVCGVTFWFEFPADECMDYSKSEVTLKVDGKRARELKVSYGDAEVNAQGLRGFTMPLTSVELGQTVSATVSFGDGETTKKSASAADVVIGVSELGEAQGPQAEALGNFATAQLNYGHYVQAFLAKTRGWEIGKDFNEAELFFPKALDIHGAEKGLLRWKTLKSDPNDDIKKIGMTTVLGATAQIDLYFTPKPGHAFGEVRVMFGADPCTAELLPDGRLHVHVEGIEVADFNKELTVRGVAGETSGAFRLSTSLLAYAQAVMKSGAYGKVGDEAMAATYWYWKYAQDYQEAMRA